MKTTQEKINEKKTTLDDVNRTLEQSMTLYDITTSQYGQLYDTNKAQVDSKHIAGIASLLSKINELLRTRNDIENEINGLLELDEQMNADNNSDVMKGSKADILKKLEEGIKK
jgi:hypothetical protein